MDKRIAYGVVIASFAFLQACTSPTKSEAPKAAAPSCSALLPMKLHATVP